MIVKLFTQCFCYKGWAVWPGLISLMLLALVVVILATEDKKNTEDNNLHYKKGSVCSYCMYCRV